MLLVAFIFFWFFVIQYLLVRRDLTLKKLHIKMRFFKGRSVIIL